MDRGGREGREAFAGRSEPAFAAQPARNACTGASRLDPPEVRGVERSAAICGAGACQCRRPRAADAPRFRRSLSCRRGQGPGAGRGSERSRDRSGPGARPCPPGQARRCRDQQQPRSLFGADGCAGRRAQSPPQPDHAGRPCPGRPLCRARQQLGFGRAWCPARFA